MPNKYKKKNTKKRTAKRSVVRKRNFYPMGNPSGMPTTRRAYLRYSDQISITSTAGIMGSYVFRANSCHDPDYSSVGHQPMGWDQWKLLYNHYVVVGARITATVLSDTLGQSPFVCGVYLTDGTTLPYTSWYGFKEARKGTQKLFNGGAGNTRSQAVMSKFSAKNFYNVSDIKDNMDRLGALVDDNPSEVAYFAIYYQQVNSVTDTKNILITIDYIVDFSEPKNLAIS